MLLGREKIMAITDMKGTVTKDQPTMTGMINKDTTKVTPPNLSSIKMPAGMAKTKSEQPKEMPVEQPKEMPIDQAQATGLMEKVQNLTDQDKAVLATVLSPSVTNALKKIAPELTPLLDQAGTAEENVIIPVSVVKNFATKRYGGEDETQAITSFIADLQESAPGMSNEMEQTNVPPDTQMAEQPESGMEQVFNAIDTEGEIV
jgi:hypothetical protein